MTGQYLSMNKYLMTETLQELLRKEREVIPIHIFFYFFRTEQKSPSTKFQGHLTKLLLSFWENEG